MASYSGGSEEWEQQEAVEEQQEAGEEQRQEHSQLEEVWGGIGSTDLTGRSIRSGSSRSRERSRGRGRSRSRSRSNERILPKGQQVEEQMQEEDQQEQVPLKRSSHPRGRLSHYENRANTCVMCWRKSSKVLKFRRLTPKIVELIRHHTHHKELDLECQSHPIGLCNTDRKHLMKIQKAFKEEVEVPGKDPREEWAERQLEDITTMDGFGGRECGCPMCHLGQYSPAGTPGAKAATHRPVLNPRGGLLESELQPSVKKKKKVST